MTGAQQFDVVVLGAGAAGMFCAALVGARGRRVLLLEAGERAGRKILISGGGRCNFTNRHTSPANFLSENPHFSKSALARYTPADFIALVERYGIAYHEKTLGQLFCDGSAQAIVAMLEAECRAAHVTLRLQTSVLRVERAEGGFAVVTPAGEVWARAVVVATGGLSIPKMGASGIGYDIARSFGLRVVEPRPALVPLTFADADRAYWAEISGVSADVLATPARRTGQAAAPAFREKMLWTHRGLSGPAVLQVSSYWQAGEPVHFDLLPGRAVFPAMTAGNHRRDGSVALQLLREHLPARLAERWLHSNMPPDWKNASMARLEERLHAWPVVPAGTEGYNKAEVTAGGVSTADLDSTTLQARAVAGLHFVGEVVDVTGHLGGFNFQWAWASAFAAAAAL